MAKNFKNDHNYKSAEEFIDVANNDYKLIRKIEFGGGFLPYSIVFDVLGPYNKRAFRSLCKRQKFLIN